MFIHKSVWEFSVLYIFSFKYIILKFHYDHAQNLIECVLWARGSVAM